MKGKKAILISLLLLIAIISTGAIAAVDSSEINDLNNYNDTITIDDMPVDHSSNTKLKNSLNDGQINDDYENAVLENSEKDNENSLLSTEDNDSLNDRINDNLNAQKTSVLKSNQLEDTYTVDGSALNQMSNPTIQNVINSAKSGDTIIITGKNYVHCHFVIDKKLTIISEVETNMSACPSNRAGSGAIGIFYISPEASGTVIQGFNIKLEDYNDYGIMIRGAQNVEIINCTVEYKGSNEKNDYGISIENGKNIKISNSAVSSLNDAIQIRNSDNVTIMNSIIVNSKIGINIKESNNTNICYNDISNNSVCGINIDLNNQNTTVFTNNITYNKKYGINIISADYIYIRNNFIGHNCNDKGSGAGVYVNCNITKIEIIGNFLKQNGQYGVLNDYRTRNMDAKKNAEKLEVVNNNYFLGHTERAAYHIEYKEYPGGAYNYDPVNDLYVFVGEGNGTYDVDKSVVYLGYAFFRDETICGATLYKAPDVTWSEGLYKLQLSEISDLGYGKYSVSIVDSNGNIITDLSSIYVTFYLNKNNTSAEPQEGDIYRTVLMENGTATVEFDSKEYKSTGNVLVAMFPGLYNVYKINPNVVYNIPDSKIPRILQTKITVSNMNTYPNSGAYFTANLKDENNNSIANKTISFTVNGKTYTNTTDANGNAKIQIKLSSEKTYQITASFDKEEGYNESSAKASITVKKTAQKITSSNKAYAPNTVNYYSITLKDENNKVISNKNVKFTINSKTYTATTNSKGIAKVKIRLSAKKTYKITVKSEATNKYKAVSKTNKITIKQLSQQIISSNKAYAPNTVNYYIIILKDQNNELIKNKKITVKIGTKTYTKKTNSKGTVKIKVKYSAKKTYKVSISSPKTSQYTGKSKTNKIVIKKLNQKITSSNKQYLPKANSYYRITVKDQNNELIKNKAVKFTINSKTYTAKTNSKGIAKLKIDLSGEKTYTLKINSPATGQYNGVTKTNKITIAKGTPSLTSCDKVIEANSSYNYTVNLKDYTGKAVSNGNITFTLDSLSYNTLTDSNGNAILNLNITEAGNYTLTTSFLGNTQNKAINNTNCITVKSTILIDENLDNDEIQTIIDNCPEGKTIEFLGKSYNDIALTINKSLNIISNAETVLNGIANKAVITINANDVSLSNLTILANSVDGESDGILINSSNNVTIINNTIINSLNETLIDDYNNGSTILPGTGIKIINSANVLIKRNIVNSFESGIYNEYSNELTLVENKLRLNNYGIKYGFGSANTSIFNNTIIDNIGWYTEEVPEGPRGYGIFLNNSAVNITIKENNISNNYMGISLDANNSTGIVITSNLIADNSLEGIRFNAGYDLAENYVEPIVTDNAIYRNAEGPSMMILGEMSANPGGIYGAGQWDDDLKLVIGPNWFGANSLRTWDYDTGIVGVGTMCPRIKATTIRFYTIEYNNGLYTVNFYKNDVLATNLATFDIYATLNRGTDNETEAHFWVENGTGYFSFDSSNYVDTNNTIEISIGSLINVVDRIYPVFYRYDVPESEIPV